MPRFVDGHCHVWPQDPARFRLADAATALAGLAARPNVLVKIAGFDKFDVPPYAGARAATVALCRLLGAGRLIWGSDLPGLEVGGGHSVAAAFRAVGEADGLSDAGKAAILGGTAARIFFQAGAEQT